MKRIHLFTGAFCGVLLFVWALALAQPPVDSLTGLPAISEPASAFGKVIFWLAQAIGGTAATYIGAKWLKKFPKIDGHVTLSLAMAISWLAMFGLSAASLRVFHYDPGMQLGTIGSFGTLLMAMMIKEYKGYKAT